MPVTLPRRAFLGAELPADAEAFTAQGLRIAGVIADGTADRAGLAGGDLIHTIAQLPVRTLAELSAALRRAGGAASTEIAFVRDGAERRVNVPVAVLPEEEHAGARVAYDAHEVAGALLRTIATRVDAPRALIACVQGIACESIDGSPMFEGLVASWTAAGYDTLRFDKRGVGDSEGGPCPATDFATELADANSVLDAARAEARQRALPLVVFGHSVGGIITALVAADIGADAVIVYGTPVLRWLACLKDSTRRQLALHGASEAEITSRVAALDELATRGELNGRSAAYHAQLDTHDLEAAWRTVRCPVLVVRGEYDWVVEADDQARIATLAQGPASIVDVPGVDHLCGWHADRDASLRDYGAGTFSPAIGAATVAWLDRLRWSA